jgi:hypothetical protein
MAEDQVTILVSEDTTIASTGVLIRTVTEEDPDAKVTSMTSS